MEPDAGVHAIQNTLLDQKTCAAKAGFPGPAHISGLPQCLIYGILQ